MFGETQDLVAALKLNDQFTGPLKKANTALNGFDAHLTNTQGRAYKAGQQIGTGILNGAKIATAALTGLAGLLLLSAKEGQEAQNVQIKYAQAIANSGKVTDAYVKALNAQQDALLGLSGVDDERIKAAQTQLIQMGLTGDKVLELTALSLDLSKATGKDLTASTLAVGKAFQGNNRALLQLGIVVPKGANAIAILNQRFKGTTQALSGQLDTRLAVLNQRLANVREQAGIKLLPVLTRIVDVVGSKLVPAFGKFIDAILPHAIAGLEKLADFLDSGQATRAFDTFLKTAQTAAPIIADAAQKTLTIVRTAVDLFASLPPEIQALAIAGLTVNKLTGGLVTNIAGGLIEAVISSFRGLMNVNAAVVNVNGPVTGLPGGGLPNVLPQAGGAATAGAGGLTAAGGAAALVASGAITAGIVGAAAIALASDPGGIKALQGQAATAKARGVPDANNAPLQKLRELNQTADRQLDVSTRIKAREDRSYDAIEHLRNSSVAATREVKMAIERQKAVDTVVNIVNTVRNVIDSRTFTAATSRYSDTFVNGVRPRVGGA